MSDRQPMTDRERELAEFVKQEQLRYQAVSLGENLETGGADRSYINQYLFRDDIAGASFLDIGASLGYFCLEALARGAASATGLDTSPERIRHARKIAEFKNAPVEYVLADFEHWQPPHPYDIVQCLNVLHHLYDPVATIHKIMRLTRRRALLEVVVISARDISLRRPAYSTMLLGARNAPVLLVDRPTSSAEAATRTFLFTPSSLAAIINGHSQAFEPVRFHPSQFKGRVVAEITRRRIGHLVVVAGVSGVGKSTFIQRLTASPELRRRFGVGDRFTVSSAEQVETLPCGEIDTLLYEYDVLRPFDRPLQSHGRDPAFDLLSSAQRLTVITLTQSPDELRARLQRAPSPSTDDRRAARRRKIILDQYKNRDFLVAWHDAWSSAVAPFAPAGGHHVVAADEHYTPAAGDVASAFAHAHDAHGSPANR